MHRLHSCCDMYSGLFEQLRVFVHCVFDDWYGVVPHFSLVVCQHLSLIVQYSLAVWVEAKPFLEAAYIIVILSVVTVGSSSFAAGSGRLVRFWGTLLGSIGRRLVGCAGLNLDWSWCGCTGLCLSGCRRICTSVILSVRWSDRTVVCVSRNWRESTVVFLGGCQPDRTSIILGGC